MKITADHLQKGIEFSIKKHSTQRRKGDKRPYFLHVAEVCIRINQMKESKNAYLLMLVAVLHDYVEDCDLHLSHKRKYAILARMFGHQVAALVEELTLDKDQYAAIGKKEYLAQHMCEMSNYALAIKLVDRWCNVIDMKTMNTSFQKKYVEETLYCLDKVHESRKLTASQMRIEFEIRQELEKYVTKFKYEEIKANLE